MRYDMMGNRSVTKRRDLLDWHLPWWGYLILLALAIGAAFLLRYANPNSFPLNRTIPATLVYFGLCWLILRYGLPLLVRRLPEGEGSFIQGHTVGEFLFALVLMCIGFLAGTGAGATWWLAGGFAATGFWTAVIGGGIVGAVAPLALLAGG
jgi:hypothetical protein